MAQLYFKYGAMGSSKTANALMARFNYEERGQKTLLVKPRMDQRDGDHMVHSRIGLEYPCVYFDEMRALSEDALKENACIIVDEAQFLSKEEVDYLVHVVDDLGVPVICYGLRADFKGELFPGSYELLVMADKLEEVKTICWCGKKAMFNARFDENGKVLVSYKPYVRGQKQPIEVRTPVKRPCEYETVEELYINGFHLEQYKQHNFDPRDYYREALKRGTSVYLADRVIPMLPHTLSNGICSLNAGEDRLALSCIMTVDPKGMVIDHEIAETVIHVDRRMSYTSVTKILEDEDLAEMQEYEELVPMFQRMLELSKILRARRKQRGSIDFDFPETKMILDENGHPIDIKPYDRNVATKIIEDFMLLANETVAEDYYWQEIPFVYRVHEAPDDEKIRALATFINNFGFSMHIGANEVRPKEIQKLLGKVEGTPQEALISRLALRSMKQARYTPENSGHFGLAANYYTHFTSPIRRYPDLQIHRIIKDNLRGRMNGERMEHYRKILEEVTKHASETERRADEAERETVKLKKVEYMSDRIGNVYTGVISSVTKWGMYVELPNTIEGLIHVANMRDDHYNYDESRYEMVGERTGKVYKLGQEVRVRVADTDRLMRTIDFVIAKERDEENGEDEW